MIDFLQGIVTRRLPTGVILNVQGVGYGVDLPLPTLCAVPEEGKPCSLWIYTRVREDAIKLFGFSTFEDRQAFSVLLNVSGVGPKVALAILSTLSIAQLKSAVETRQTHFLETVPGIGHRTAEKILVELQNKIDKLPGQAMVPDDSPNLGSSDQAHANRERKDFQDLYSALENLGFKQKDILPVIKTLARGYKGEQFQDLIRRALTLIHKPSEAAQEPARSLEQIF